MFAKKKISEEPFASLACMCIFHFDSELTHTLKSLSNGVIFVTSLTKGEVTTPMFQQEQKTKQKQAKKQQNN